MLTSNEQRTKEAYDANAQKWAKSHSIENFWQDKLDRFYELLPSGKVLEVGSGAGRDAKALINFGYDYLGTDLSARLLRIAQAENPTATFEEKNLYNLNYGPIFDGFWCSAVLLHIPKERIDEALTAIRSNIRSGGVGFIAIKQGDISRLERFPDNTERFFAYWQDEDFCKKLQDNNLNVTEKDFIPMSEDTKWLTYFVEAV